MQNARASLLLDEDVWPGLAAALRKRGIDALSVHELGRTGLSDSEQLAFAVDEGRAILTHNAGDFVGLARDCYIERKSHCGILIAPHLEKGALVRRSIALLETVTRTALMNTVRYV